MKTHSRYTSWIVAILPFLLASCLITSAPTYSNEEACYPVLLSHEAVPSMLQLFSVDFRQSETGNRSKDLRLTVPLRTCSIARTYTANWFIDTTEKPITKAVVANGTEFRTLELLLTEADLSALSEGCHRLELRVSSRFAGDDRTPENADDIALLVWWFDVIKSSTETPVHTLAQCPNTF